MTRSAVLGIAATAAALFITVSFVLARGFGAASSERAAVVEVIRHQARGDAAAVVDDLAGCRARPACVAHVRATVARLRRPGRFQVVRVDTSTQFALRSGRGVARIVWRAGAGRPVVQCVTVRRAGSLLAGLDVDAVGVSGPLPGEASC